jgi:uncharacterized protein (DUF2252 family)
MTELPVRVVAAHSTHKPETPAPAASLLPVHSRSLEERAVEGKVLRVRVARVVQGQWKRSDTRADPIDILQAADVDRLPELVPIRYGRMIQSPFAFYRGSAGVMAADLAVTPSTGIKVQVCGDCHLMNFGGFATPERNILFDINDSDETLPALWEWDVKRLAASFVLAARSVGLSDAKGREAAEVCARNYRKHLREYAVMHPLDVWYARVTGKDVLATWPPTRRGAVQGRLDKALERSGSEVDFPKLAGMVGGRLGIRDTPPLIFHPEISRSPDFHAVVDKAFSAYRETLSDARRALLDRYRVVDAAIKVVGVGSVGRRCWITLLMSASNEPLFLQLKEAVASVLEPFAGKSVYLQHGQRVVMGQRLMQPASDQFLGWLTVAASGKHYYVCQLRDAKIKPLVETFDSETLLLYAKVLRLGAGARPFESKRRLRDSRVSWYGWPVRRGGGPVRAGLCGSGGTQGRRAEGQDNSAAGRALMPQDNRGAWS